MAGDAMMGDVAPHLVHDDTFDPYTVTTFTEPSRND
jgi:hypothetical protein